ncbi:MAG: hypothetical protein JSW50_11695 [Candidatus Latescibacterota bacterium]|nr:MAG: hypothetical protein JSW50_11695 [Candidatus Latescibacterota bacterium]
MRNGVMVFLALVLVLGLSWTGGSAQVVMENHYLVYEVPQAYTFTGQITLIDQFRQFSTDFVELDKFATPVEKNGEPVFDYERHQTWWMIDDPQSIWWTLFDNQFGRQQWRVKDGRYLVLPAFKNQPGGGYPTMANHYKCYDAIGPPVDITVLLVDQFYTYQMIAKDPVLFCNPVEKWVDGNMYPIAYPDAHLACYRLEPIMTTGWGALASDQFGMWQLELIEPCWLCLPTLKIEAVPNEPSTWGKIKSLYSN